MSFFIKDQKKVIESFHRGDCDCAYAYLGCHWAEGGRIFKVWAPNARSVSVVGDFNFWNCSDLPMEKDARGVWFVFSEHAKPGDRYKYYIERPDGSHVYKSDPYSLQFAPLPDTSGIICDIEGFPWTDGGYYEKKQKKNFLESPVNIYELHLGSWRRHEDGSCLSYAETAGLLIPYLRKMHYTHVELMPVTEYPYEPSWGYQVTGYFAPTHRYGTPAAFMTFINQLHRAGIGVILDWVPAHFPKDEAGLFEFDGTCCYESADPLMNEHPDWNTRIFDYSRNEVSSFLLSSACFWIREYHADGIRVDAVASMLYLDYGRKEFHPNRFGGKENLDAIAFLRKLNEAACRTDPSVLMIAEESTAFPLVTKPEAEGGLGFRFKWNMGWMNDILGYMQQDPLYRKGCHQLLTFSLTYAFSENYVLPFSHDETVHGKRSLIGKMPGEYGGKFDQLRLLFAYMTAHPGKKLNFMGNEFAQFIEWDFRKELDWFLLEYESHRRFHRYTGELNRFYLESPELWENDADWNGFSWISADDSSQSVIAFRRRDRKGGELVCIFNFCPVLRTGYRIGLPSQGSYQPVFYTGCRKYGGDGKVLKAVEAERTGFHGLPFSGIFRIPGFSASFYRLLPERIR